MDGLEKAILNLVCHVNPGNEVQGSGLYWNPFATTLQQILLNKNTTSLVKSNTPYKDGVPF